MQAAWRRVLVDPIDVSPHRLVYDVDRAALLARDVFPGDRRVWGLALQFSPDVLISAESPEAFARGELSGVLGEMHGGNTLHSVALLAQHPAVDDLRAALAHDTSGTPVVFRQLPKSAWIVRSSPLLVLPTFYRFEIGDDLASLPACRPLPAAMLVAVDDGISVKMRARDGSFSCEAYELFCDRLSYEISGILARGLAHAGAVHTPRIDLGPLTIARERWETTAEAMSFLDETDRSRRFALIRAWARDLGMPRWVFFKTPIEKKPCYLDFDSLVYVDLFAKFVRQVRDRTSTITFTAMQPGLDETWLCDGAGNRYTCELRLVAQRSAI
jgi:hypothetical protein